MKNTKVLVTEAFSDAIRQGCRHGRKQYWRNRKGKPIDASVQIGRHIGDDGVPAVIRIMFVREIREALGLLWYRDPYRHGGLLQDGRRYYVLDVEAHHAACERRQRGFRLLLRYLMRAAPRATLATMQGVRVVKS